VQAGYDPVTNTPPIIGAPVAYTSIWTHQTGIANAFWSTTSYASVVTRKASFGFNGSRITLFYTMYTNRGLTTIRIDGDPVTNPGWNNNGSGYAPELRRQVGRTWTVDPGDHTLEIKITGTGEGGGAAADIDAFAVDIAYKSTGIYDDRDPHVRYFGYWGAYSGIAGAYNGTTQFSNESGALFRFTFWGDSVTYRYSRAANSGKAAITIDGLPVQVAGENKGYLDLYGPATLRDQSTTFSGYGPGAHVMTVMVSPFKNPASIDYFVDIDRVVVP
jgi:hypothetical protein